MTHKLYPLTVTRFPNPDLAQFIVRFFDDLDKSGIRYTNDEVLVSLINQLKGQHTPFQKSIEQVRASDKTVALAKADRLRDEAYKALGSGLKAYQYSTVEAEKAAYTSLNILFKQYKPSTGKNYEAQTNLLTNFAEKMTTAPYKDQVNLLGLKRFVDRLVETNRNFDALYASRSQDKLTKVAYNSKELKADVIYHYNLLVDYINVMAQAKKTKPYTDLLNVVNHTRKTYADLQARGTKGKKNDKAEK